MKKNINTFVPKQNKPKRKLKKEKKSEGKMFIINGNFVR